MRTTQVTTGLSVWQDHGVAPPGNCAKAHGKYPYFGDW